MGGFCKSLQLGPFRRYQGKQLQFKGGNSELFLFEKMTWSLPASKLASGNGREVGNLNKKKKNNNGEERTNLRDAFLHRQSSSALVFQAPSIFY